ncbi:MAG: phosphatase PAP2 family protein [bacterium]|nr:phosphatase PAP2 family protein [bacterium]
MSNRRSMLAREAGFADVVRIAALGTYVAAFIVVMVSYGVPTDREQVFLWLVGLIVAVSLVRKAGWRTMVRALGDWSVLAVLLVIYDYSRGAADWLGMPLQIEAPIVVDRALFPGDVPTIELQSRLGPFLGEQWWEAAISLVYVSHFFVPYLIMAILWLSDRERWRAWLALFVGVTIVGLIGYIALPTMPPWLASHLGFLDPVERTATRGMNLLHLTNADELIEKGQAAVNLVAAFPSLHAAYPALVAMFFRPRGRSRYKAWLRVILVSYSLAMGFTLVLSGEHYVVDVLGGWLVAGLVSVLGQEILLRSRLGLTQGDPDVQAVEERS